MLEMMNRTVQCNDNLQNCTLPYILLLSGQIKICYRNQVQITAMSNTGKRSDRKT